MEYPMECTMSMAIEYIIYFRLEKYQNLHAEQKHFLYKLKEKEFNSVIPFFHQIRSQYYL